MGGGFCFARVLTLGAPEHPFQWGSLRTGVTRGQFHPIQRGWLQLARATPLEEGTERGLWPDVAGDPDSEKVLSPDPWVCLYSPP